METPVYGGSHRNTGTNLEAGAGDGAECAPTRDATTELEEEHQDQEQLPFADTYRAAHDTWIDAILLSPYLFPEISCQQVQVSTPTQHGGFFLRPQPPHTRQTYEQKYGPQTAEFALF